MRLYMGGILVGCENEVITKLSFSVSRPKLEAQDRLIIAIVAGYSDGFGDEGTGQTWRN